MRFESRVFWLSKDSSYPDEYQDAFQLDAKRGRAAIADGVSSAIFSGCWARILTAAAVTDPPPHDAELFQLWLVRQRAAWTRQIDVSGLTWYQKPKMVDGAMSTLLWITLAPLPEQEGSSPLAYRLNGWAIGDCCLFHVRDNQLLHTFPIASAAEFGLNPAVLGSIDRKHDHFIEFQELDITCYPTDLLVLCSDAIALWAMNRYEIGETVTWESYWDISPEAWQEEIFAQREANLMRFDDCTLVLLRPTSCPSPDEQSPDDSSQVLAEIPIIVSDLAEGSAELVQLDADLLPSALAGRGDEVHTPSPDAAPICQQIDSETLKGTPMRRALAFAKSLVARREPRRSIENDARSSAEVKENREHPAVHFDADDSDQSRSQVEKRGVNNDE